MGTLGKSAHPKLLANTVKHFAFAGCAELNLYGMVDAQLALVEGELLATDAPVSCFDLRSWFPPPTATLQCFLKDLYETYTGMFDIAAILSGFAGIQSMVSRIQC